MGGQEEDGMKKKLRYTAIIELDEDGFYVAEIPSIRACYAQGKTYEEAVENLQDVLEMCLEEMKSRNEEIPPSSEVVGFKRMEVRV